MEEQVIEQAVEAVQELSEQELELVSGAAYRACIE
jgi:hypothetical protein